MKQSREDRYSPSVNKGRLISLILTWTLLYKCVLHISQTREITEERNIGPTYPSAVLPDPAEKILPEKVHGPL